MGVGKVHMDQPGQRFLRFSEVGVVGGTVRQHRKQTALLSLVLPGNRLGVCGQFQSSGISGLVRDPHRPPAKFPGPSWNS